MPCQELFLDQPKEYQEQVLPSNTKIIAIEASTKENWCKFTNYDNIIGLSTFGYSGKEADVLRKLEFDKESIKAKVIELLNK